MSNQQLEKELARASLVPARFMLIKLIRRLIWPFIRPFHLFHLRYLEKVEKELNELRNEIRFVRTELLALKNSYLKIDIQGADGEVELKQIKDVLHDPSL